jgi:hypothetical protein
MAPEVVDEIQQGRLESDVQVSVLLEIDLQHLIYWDQFVGENFIRCIFRYYPCLSNYIREIFMLKLEEDQLMYPYERPKHERTNLAVQALRQMRQNDGRTLK